MVAILSAVIPLIAVKENPETSAKDELSADDCIFTDMFALLCAVQCKCACPPNVELAPKSTEVVFAVALVLVKAYKLFPFPKLSPVKVAFTPTGSPTLESMV